MLIVEGPDNVGKTTLCKTLVHRLGEAGLPAVYRHFTRLPACWDFYHDYLPHISRYAVMDRFWPSELAYARARGEQSGIDSFIQRLLEAHLTLDGTLYVVVTATERRLRADWTGDDEMYTLDKVLAANGVFQDMRIAGDVVRYELTSDTPWPGASAMLVDDVVAKYLAIQDRMRGIHSRRKPL